jgi:hypothetical protein
MMILIVIILFLKIFGCFLELRRWHLIIDVLEDAHIDL